jgi:predicted MFS family arabinose efflux permease
MKHRNMVLMLCIAINIMDGFDIVAAAVTGPSIAQSLKLIPSQLGIFFAGVPLGMIFGALILSSLSDRFGRRAMLVTSLILMCLGMGLATEAQTLSQLVMTRVLTGLGVGGVIAIVNTIGAEHAPAAKSVLWVSLITLGMLLGLTIGGLLAIPLLAFFGWRSIFMVGAIGTLLLIPLVLFLVQKDVAVGDDDITPPLKHKIDFREVMRKPNAANIAIITAIFVAIYISTFFILSWTPKIMVDSGLSVSQGATSSVLLTLGGMCGAAAFGFAGSRLGLGRIGPFIMMFAFVMTIVSAISPPQTRFLFPLLLVVGFGMTASNAAMNAALPHVFPVQIRGTATGLAFGIGRLGAIFGPIAGGLLIGSGLSRFQYTALMSAPFMIGAMLLLLLLKRARQRND